MQGIYGSGKTGSRNAGKKVSHSHYLILVALLCGASSCARLSGQLSILEGNFLASLGIYNEAITAYLEAVDNASAAPYAEFGLSSVYALLGENSLALQRLERAEAGLDALAYDPTELAYRIYYNRGVILYREGGFPEAAAAFRKALEIDGKRTEAKRNLELSLLARETPPPDPVKVMESTGSEVLYDYIRRREQEQWKSQQWSEESSEGLDY
ncbi:MAG: tetratricopeptide repeat protein [Treponema sp.]|jgi:Ca-activated chloride channel family protein|nr:tetratricopeptide repeat protein [Treponema sp.]